MLESCITTRDVVCTGSEYAHDEDTPGLFLKTPMTPCQPSLCGGVQLFGTDAYDASCFPAPNHTIPYTLLAMKKQVTPKTSNPAVTETINQRIITHLVGKRLT